MSHFSLIFSRAALIRFAAVLLLLAVNTARGMTYEVGPGQANTTLSAVPWPTLQPGDVVNIHYQPGGYHEIISIQASGTAAQHIVIHGVPDPATGALPIIDGQDAIQAPDIKFYGNGYVFYTFCAVIVNAKVYGDIAKWIDLENLEIRNAKKSNTFTAYNKATTHFDQFAAGIYVSWAQHLVIRNCTLHDNGNGLVVNSLYGFTGLSSDVLVEHCRIHHNGNAGSFSEHNIYTETGGVVMQFNTIGPLTTGANGENIKDRSAGTVIRYNRFIMGGSSGTCAWLEQPQGGLGAINTLSTYKASFIYGNTIYNGADGGSLIFRYDSGAENLKDARHGTLYFYNNTVVNVADRFNGTAGPGRYKTWLFMLPSAQEAAAAGVPVDEIIDCRNNIIVNQTATATGAPSFMSLLLGDAGTMNLGVNYVSPGIANYELPNNSASFAGTINGLSNLLYGDSMGKNNPGFANLAGQDFHLAAGSFCIDKAGAQAAATIGAYDVTSQYLDPESSQARVTIGSAPELGAFEYAPPGTAAPSLLNISTRAQVQNGESVLIGGFIVTGKATKKVILRAIGPSLQSFGLTGVLADPVLELHGPAAFVTVTNDNWQDDPDQTTQIQASGLAPRNSLESAIIATLVPGAYTAIVSSKSGLPGIGLVEAYDLDPIAGAQLANISTRGSVQVADSVMIGGFTLGGAPDNAHIAVRGLGPSLASSGLSNVLADPTLELHNANGTVMISNDDWTDDKASADLLTANGLALKDPKEAGIFTSLPSGPFTVILAGKSGGVGMGLIEIYNVK